MHREGRELIPTAKAFQLMTLLRGLQVEELTKPELTGNWEYQLAEMEKGRLSRERFMAAAALAPARSTRRSIGSKTRRPAIPSWSRRLP